MCTLRDSPGHIETADALPLHPAEHLPGAGAHLQQHPSWGPGFVRGAMDINYAIICTLQNLKWHSTVLASRHLKILKSRMSSRMF